VVAKKQAAVEAATHDDAVREHRPIAESSHAWVSDVNVQHCGFMRSNTPRSPLRLAVPSLRSGHTP
jgi:hypothetical protein